MAEFENRKDSSYVVTRECVSKKFAKEFRRTGNKILLDERFKKAAAEHLEFTLPAIQRTRKALLSDPIIPLTIEAELNRFISMLNNLPAEALKSTTQVNLHFGYLEEDKIWLSGNFGSDYLPLDTFFKFAELRKKNSVENGGNPTIN